MPSPFCGIEIAEDEEVEEFDAHYIYKIANRMTDQNASAVKYIS